MGRGTLSARRLTGSGSTSNQSVDERVRSSREYVGQQEVENQIDDYIRYNLGDGETSAGVDSFRIISNPGDGEFGDVEAQYHVNVRIPIGYDDETGRMEYETDTEYRSETFQVRLRNRRR